MRLKVRILVRVLTLSAMLLFFFGIGLCRGGHNQAARAKARHFFLKAAVKEAEGKMDEAHEYYKLAYQSDTSYHEAAYNYGLGRLARVIGALQQDSVELEENISFLRKMSDLFPRDVDFSETYAFYLVNSDSLPKALDVYRRLIGHRPGLSRLYITQAYLYAMHEEIDSAVNAMREYERLEGVSSESTLRKASYHLVKGDTVGALEEFRAFAETNPRDIETIMSVSMAYNLLGRQDSAYSIIKDAAVKYPDNMALQFELALIAKEAGDVEEFFRSGSKALKSPDIEDIQRLGMLEDFIGALPQDSVSYRRGEELMKELSSMM